MQINNHSKDPFYNRNGLINAELYHTIFDDNNISSFRRKTLYSIIVLYQYRQRKKVLFQVGS